MFEENDIIQIVDANHPWYPSLLVVDKVKSWGVQAYCYVPQSNSENQTSQAYNRLNNNQIVKVGHAEIVNA